MKKVCIVTLHGANNVGAFLQAYSLQRTITGMGDYDVCFAKFPRTVEQKGKLRKVLSYIKKGELKKLMFKKKTAKVYSDIRTKLKIAKDEITEQPAYDIVVVGSDEVWNLYSKSFVHYPQYFGKKLNAPKVISYAPSANICQADEVRNAGYTFDEFAYISVRDTNTSRMVEEISGKTPQIVCDPTVLLGDFYEEFSETYVDEKDYILVYSYGLPQETVQEIKKLARKKKKKLISVGTYNDWCDKNIVVNPFEFLAWLDKSDFVIAATFHGTVLSTLLGKSLAVYPGKQHKTMCYIEQIGIKNRIMTGDASLEEIYDTPMDYQKINETIKEFRNTSLDFLKKALEDEE